MGIILYQVTETLSHKWYLKYNKYDSSYALYTNISQYVHLSVLIRNALQ